MPVHAVRDMSTPAGLDANKWYEARVIDNDDQEEKLGRIKARIATVFDGIPDEDLAWAIPVFEHTDGASSTSGTFSVPKVGTKVFLKFQQANPMFPMYRGFHVDKSTRMPEVEYNYPDRAVARFQNNALMVIDTKDNTVYLRNPGDLKIYVQGNVELEVAGNVDEKVHGNVRRTIEGNLDEHVQGNVTRKIEGNLDEVVTGNRSLSTEGNFASGTSGSMQIQSEGIAVVESSATLVLEGATIHENSGMGLGTPTAPSTAEDAQFTDWPGIPGGAKG